MLLGQARLASSLKRAAQDSPADETLIAAERESKTTLRFAAGRIHQNFHEEEVSVWVKVARGGKTGVATTSSLRHEALLKAIRAAAEIARLSAQQTPPAFSTRPPAQPPARVETHFARSDAWSVGGMVREVDRLTRQARKVKADLSGSFVLGERELCVVGSGGLLQYQPFSVAGIRLIPSLGGATGFAAQTVRDLAGLKTDPLLERALAHCRRNRNPRNLPPGRYDVLLEPEAVAELAEWLSFIGFGAKTLREGTGFMTGRFGERIMDSKISILDDGTDPEGLAVPFDYEGVPKKRVCLIRKGKAEGVVYDSQYAKLHHRRSTGHALPYDETNEGPLATHLFLEPGTAPHAELLKRLRRGLWITRFHYVNGFLDTHEALMTGLTRDGTFWVEKGKVTAAVKNLRFTQSILEAFSRVAGISQERRLVADPGTGFSSVVAPALLIRNFTFTGQTR